MNRLFNLATKVTLTRILLIPVFMFFLLAKQVQPVGLYVAVGIFGVAALSDTVDGYIARNQKQVTIMGKFLDPLADKLLISAALIALVELERLSSWVAIIIITREFAVSGLRLVAAAEKRVIDASILGKVKTISQIAAVIAVILDLPIQIAGKSLGWILMAVAVILTVVSGIDYFVRAKDVLEPLANQKKVS